MGEELGGRLASAAHEKVIGVIAAFPPLPASPPSAASCVEVA